MFGCRSLLPTAIMVLRENFLKVRGRPESFQIDKPFLMQRFYSTVDVFSSRELTYPTYSHLGKRKIIFQHTLGGGYVIVPRRVNPPEKFTQVLA